MDKEKIGIFIAELRKQEEMTQEQLAQKVFVDISKFNRIWNTMANEYGFIITQTDIAEINRKASESTTLHIF